MGSGHVSRTSRIRQVSLALAVAAIGLSTAGCGPLRADAAAGAQGNRPATPRRRVRRRPVPRQRLPDPSDRPPPPSRPPGRRRARATVRRRAARSRSSVRASATASPRTNRSQPRPPMRHQPRTTRHLNPRRRTGPTDTNPNGTRTSTPRCPVPARSRAVTTPTCRSGTGKKKANLEFCTQILREKATGDYALNPYVYAEVFYRGDSGAWVPENEVESNVMSITAEVRHQLADDATQLTAGGTDLRPSPSQRDRRQRSSGIPVSPHRHPPDRHRPVRDHVRGEHDRRLRRHDGVKNEIHFPGLDGELPEQHVRLP